MVSSVEDEINTGTEESCNYAREQSRWLTKLVIPNYGDCYKDYTYKFERSAVYISEDGELFTIPRNVEKIGEVDCVVNELNNYFERYKKLVSKNEDQYKINEFMNKESLKLLRDRVYQIQEIIGKDPLQKLINPLGWSK